MMSSGPNRAGKTQADKVQAKSKVPEHKLVRHRKKGWGMGFKCTGETHEAQVKQIRLSQWQETGSKTKKRSQNRFQNKTANAEENADPGNENPCGQNAVVQLTTKIK